MKTFTMKALAVAVLGLGASSAMAVCPTDPAAPAGPWSSKVQSGGTVAISATGYGTPATACKLDTKFTVNNAFAQATVVDTTPVDEPHYRARFYFNADTVLAPFGAFDAVQIFTANAAASFPATNPTLQILRLTLQGGATRQLGIIAACNNGGGNTCTATSPLTAGTNVIEIEVTMGAAGTVKYWVNNNVAATPTGSVTLTGGNLGWIGPTEARLGLAGATLGFRTSHLNQLVSFDEFDSRRQTFIGF